LVFRDAADRKEAKHYKHLLGGAMRQSGILSAAGIYALMHNISRLQEDHANTKLLASELAECDQSIRIVNNPPQTNILVFDWIDSKKSHQDFHQSCIEMGIRFSHLSGNRYRAVLHLDISREQVLEAANIIREICLTPTIRARL